MSTLRMADGAFPIATRLTVHPVGLVNLDQSPGSPTPISARLSLPPAASALFRSNGKDAAIMLEANPSFIRSRRVGAGTLSMLSSLGRAHPRTVRCFSSPPHDASLAGAPYPPPPHEEDIAGGSLLHYQPATCSSRTRNAHPHMGHSRNSAFSYKGKAIDVRQGRYCRLMPTAPDSLSAVTSRLNRLTPIGLLSNLTAFPESAASGPD